MLTGRMEFNHMFFYSLFNPLEVFFQYFGIFFQYSNFPIFQYFSSFGKKKSVIPEDPAKAVKLVLPEGST